MKRSILAASAVAVFAFAGSAQAHADSPGGSGGAATTANIAINAQVDSKCGISSTASSITLGDLTDSNALVRDGVTEEIAQKLNAANVVAFCNNGGSKVEVKRAVLAPANTAGNGLVGDFAQYIRYNLDTSINGLALDSTSVAGPSTVSQRFGGHYSASEAATHVVFAKAATAGTAIAATGDGNRTSTNWTGTTDRRMVAGNYTGYVSIELTPGA